MTTTASTPLPTLHLYTHSDLTTHNNNKSTGGGDDEDSFVQLYRHFLIKNHGPVDETDLAYAPDVYADLCQRFPHLPLPGILLNNDVWVHGANGRELQAAWGKAWFDHVLNTQDDDDDDEDEEEDEDLDIDHVPFPRTETTFVPPSPPRQQQLLSAETLHSANSQSTSIYTSPSASSSSHLANIVLPNGTSVDMGALIRLLMRATHHNTAERDGHRFFYFRGFEGMELWSILFFEDPHTDVTEFGRMLVERGVVHNYTPNCADFSKTFLVLQPLKEPRVLNSFVQWPATATTKADPPSATTKPSSAPADADSITEDSMEVLLRLSRLMDEICATDYREHLSLYHEFEIGCCQLQVMPLPVDQQERVTFLLNLYNMAVRHAVIICQERRWPWPTDLANLHAFFTKTGYTVNGTWVSLAELQTVLYGNTEIVMPPLKTERVGFWKRWSLCRPGAAVETVDAPQYYSNGAIRTDARLLFAMTLGIKGSPSVVTLYPNRLEEGLQTATEVFAREHVKITDTCVILPALTSWFRHDLGDGTAKMALHYLLPFLSVEQMRALDRLWQRDILDVEFGRSDTDWTPAFATLPTSVASTVGKRGSGKRMETTTEPDAIPEPPAPIRHTSSDFTFRKLSTLTSEEEFSVSPAPELHDPASDLIDPTPLNPPCSVASRTKGTKHTEKPSLLAQRQPSFHHHPKPGVLLRRLWGRYPSVGDIAPRRPGLLDKTETHYDDEDEDESDRLDVLSDDGHSFFQSVVSEITYGSEFRDLLSRRSKRRLQEVQQGDGEGY